MFPVTDYIYSIGIILTLFLLVASGLIIYLTRTMILMVINLHNLQTFMDNKSKETFVCELASRSEIGPQVDLIPCGGCVLCRIQL